MNMYYYINGQGIRKGPFTINDLMSQEITPDTMVQCKGTAKWQRAKDVTELSLVIREKKTVEVSPETSKPEIVEEKNVKENYNCNNQVESVPKNDVVINKSNQLGSKDSSVGKEKTARESYKIKKSTNGAKKEDNNNNRNFYLLCFAFIAVLLISLFAYEKIHTGISSDQYAYEDVYDKDSIAVEDAVSYESHVDNGEIIKDFIRKMYDDELYTDDSFLKKHCTRSLLNKLKEDYEYEGGGLASWDFRTGAQDCKSEEERNSYVISVTDEGDDWYSCEYYDMGWKGKTRIKAYMQDDIVMMAALEKVYSECDLALESKEGNNDEDKTTISSVEDGLSVDLGLSVIWSNRNIGARNPLDDGDLYGWGNTNLNLTKTLSNYPSKNAPSSLKGTSYDVARNVLGGQWRMPTLSELKELKDKCTWEVEYANGRYYTRVTGPNGNSIVFPWSGYSVAGTIKSYNKGAFIWSSDIYSGNSQFAANLTFGEGNNPVTSGYFRYSGQSIRAVRNHR